MKNILCLIFLFIGIILTAQDFEKGRFRIKIKSDNAKQCLLQDANKFSENEKINQIFARHMVNSFEQAYPYAKNPELLKVFIVKFNGDDEDFKKELDANTSDLISDVERIPIPIPTYDPTDYMWYIPTVEDPNGWLWHLKRIQASQAWDITKSNSNIKIGIIDSDFDILHPDLNAKIIPNCDPVTGIVHLARESSHGTTVASFAAAHTDGGGQLASSGFNSTIVAYTYYDGVAKALHASDVMNVDVISISWFYSCGTASPIETLMIQEILDNGTIIVAAAGNGLGQCGGGPIGPFSPLVDPRIICVTSTGIDDKHFNSAGGTHSGYPAVSICAPGYSIMGATPSILNDGTPNTWPYFGGCTGTSFATPIVAGVCSLMKSINPCLTSTAAKNIIQATTDPVIDGSSYPGLVGSGRINAFKAVKSAGTKSASGIMSGINTYTAGFAANLNNLTIQNNANISIWARKEINISGTFEVPLGSSVNFSIDSNAINSCNW
jgi:subtilisin family serine protease